MKVQTPIAKNEEHLRFIRGLPCLVCGDNITTEAAHFSAPLAGLGKEIKGTGNKSRGPNGEECYVLPLCQRHHDHQTKIGEAKFWGDWGYTFAEVIAKTLSFWIYSGDQVKGEQIATNR